METEYFRITPATHIRVAAGEWAARRWWTIAIPIAACLVAALWQPLMLVVAVGLLLVVIPGILAIVYLDYALRPLAAFATITHCVIISGDDISIRYKPDDEEHPVPPVQTYTFADIKYVEDTGSMFILHLKSSPYDFILIPARLLPPDCQSRLLTPLS